MRDTNAKMLIKLLDEYEPQDMGIVSAKEVKQIRRTLCLGEMDILDLRNLRDFTVIFITSKTSRENDNSLDKWDKMSAITCVIDAEIIMDGGEI